MNLNFCVLALALDPCKQSSVLPPVSHGYRVNMCWVQPN